MYLASLLLGLLACWIVIGSLIPFDWVDSFSQGLLRLRAGLSLSMSRPVVAAIVERLACFVPLGLLLDWTLAAERRRPLRRAIALLTCFLVLTEFAQALVSSRHPRVLDAVTGLACGTIGAVAGTRTRRLRARLMAAHEAHVRLIAGTLLALGNGLAGFLLILAHFGVGLEGWDMNYPLLVANERTADRPWIGRIRGLAIYPRALTAEQIAGLATKPLIPKNGARRRSLGPVALYHFGRIAAEHLVRDAADGTAPDLVLPEPGPSTWRMGDQAVDINGPITIESVKAAGAISRAISLAGSFTVEIEVSTEDLTQSGPARLVGISENPSKRNFTVGQHDEQFCFRVRTPRTGPNGAAVRCRSRPVLVRGRWQHIAAGCGDGVVRLYADGRPARRPLYLYSPVVFFVRSDSVECQALVLLVLFGPLGILAGTLFAPWPRTKGTLSATAAACLVPLVSLTATTAALGRHYDRVFLGSAVLVSLSSVVLGRVLGGRESSRETGRTRRR